MKPEPIIAMILLIALGMWLVLQPTLRRGGYDLDIRVGSHEYLLQRIDDPVSDGGTGYVIVAPPDLRGDWIRMDELDGFLAEQIAEWESRPAIERVLLGFFNVTRWSTFGWVLLGLGGQGAFFGRMMIQWITSERSRVSTVPELFWWLSLFGGVALFAYFVWRRDAVGVLGQSTGVVIYARNLRLIHKERGRLKGAGQEQGS